MTIATSDQASVGSSTAATARPSISRKPRRWRVDVIGALALVLAAAGLVGTVMFLRTTATAPPPAIPAPVIRDQWYLDPPNAPAVQHAELPALAVKDRWYEDAASATTIAPGESRSDAGAQVTNVGVPPEAASAFADGVPAARDQWYLDHPGHANGPKPSTPVRDQWSLDGRETRAMVPLPRPQDPAKDRWYRE